MEPLFQSPADDVSHGLELPLRPFKDSIYKVFVAKEGHCMFGDVERNECKKVETRIQRALGHVRGHLGHRPFVCDGCIRCNTRTKYVCRGRRISDSILTSFNRKARFFSWDLLQEHKNVLEKRKKCPLCGQLFGRSALDRHLETRHGKARSDHSANPSPSPAPF